MHASDAASEGSGNSALRPHRLDERTLAELCSAGESPRATRALLDAEYSRRLLLLRALVDEVSSRPAGTGPLPPARAAWDLLARSQRENPEAVHRLLMDPQTGLWAAQALRRLRGSQEAAGPLWCEVGQLHALAAAAAVRAGLGFRIRVPAVGGAVLLPGLGRAHLDIPEPWTTAEVHRQDGVTRISTKGAVVDVPAHAAEDAPHWCGLRQLTLSHRGLTLDLTFDDLARYPVIAGTAAPERLDETALRHWRRGLERAWAMLVDDHRDSAEALSAGLFSLVPLPPADRFRPRSASASEAFGCVTMSAQHPHIPDDEATAELAVTLVHEFRHTLLNGLMHLTLLAEDCPDVFRAPWRDDPRPLTGVVHGAFAFSGVARFWRTRAERDHGSARDRARFEYALWRRESRATLELLHPHPALTDTGRLLVRGLLADLRSWESDRVPESTLSLAEQAAAHHRAAWRAHHLVPDESAVRATADSWLHGTPPPRPAAEEPGSVVIDPGGCRIDAYAHLVRLRITDPPAFAEAADGGPRPNGVTPADVAHVAGDLTEAARRYAEDTTRPASWGGLSLLLGAERPELLRAVSRTVTRRTGRPPHPAELTRWLAGAEDAYRGSGSMSQSARVSQSTA
ncbi:HEXXH motif domain-containing protein [Streptomyces sp. NPDC054829]